MQLMLEFYRILIIFTFYSDSNSPLKKMPLDKDNPDHRNFSDRLDALPRSPMDAAIYNRFQRPIIHGVYHAARFVSSGNPEEWARSKDQFSKVFSPSLLIYKPRTQCLGWYWPDADRVFEETPRGSGRRQERS